MSLNDKIQEEKIRQFELLKNIRTLQNSVIDCINKEVIKSNYTITEQEIRFAISNVLTSFLKADHINTLKETK